MPAVDVALGCIVGDPEACNAAGHLFEGHRCTGAEASECDEIGGLFIGPTGCNTVYGTLQELQSFSNGTLCEPTPATLWSDIASTCCQSNAAIFNFCGTEDSGHHRPRPMISVPELEVWGNPARTANPAAVRVTSEEASANLTAFIERIL